MVHHQFLVTMVVVLLTVAGASVTTQLEYESRYLIAAQALLSTDRPAVLRNSLNFCWVAGGAVLGGYVAVALRNITGLHHIVKYYAVSVATALATAPYVLTTFFGPLLSPEACFLVGFLFAVAAWLGWEVVGILARRLKRAAAQRGWLGIKDEITGSKSVVVLLALCLPMTAYAQITIGDAIPASEVAHAKATLDKATPKTLSLQPGEFEVIEPAKGVSTPLLWIVSNEAALNRIEIAAEQPLALWMKRRGDAAPKLHQFPAKPTAWVILVGVQQGTANVLIVRNGTNNAAPVVVDTLVVSVGAPAPVPPTPPVEDELTKSLRAALQQDQQTGRAEKKWLQALANLYAAASRDSLESIKSASDLDQFLITARQAAGIPDPEQMLPTLRQRLRQELLTQLNVTEQNANQPFTVEARRIARQTLTHIAQALEVISR